MAPHATCDKDDDDTGSPLFPDSDVEGEDFNSRWVPPDLVNKEDDYHFSDLKKDGHL